MSREAFNWSALDRATLYSMLYAIRKEIVDKTLSVIELNSIISSHIKNHLPVRVTSSKEPAAKKKEVWIGGMYHSDYDKAGYTRFIEVQLAYAENQRQIKLSRKRFKRVCVVFADVMLHEIIHTRQFRARNFKPIAMYQSNAEFAQQRRDQEYYGDRDEMGAHAFNLACDMYDNFGNDIKAISAYLDRKQPNRKRKVGWQRFLAAFDNNHNHPKVRQMKRKILKQLEYAEIGRPFKTTDHLTY
jgi:hypothetical protein